MPAAATAMSLPNPFSTRFVRPGRTPYHFADGAELLATAAGLIDLLQRRGAAAIVGPHGTGKSTLVHTLLPYLEQTFPVVSYLQLSSAANASAALRRWQLTTRESIKAGGCLVIDGFEQLSWLARQRIISQIISQPRWRRWTQQQHRSAPMQRPCLLVTSHRPQLAVKTLLRTDWDDAVVTALTQEKLAGLPPRLRERMLQVAGRQAASMARRRNVRDFWFTLYDEYERLRWDDSASSCISDSAPPR